MGKFMRTIVTTSFVMGSAFALSGPVAAQDENVLDFENITTETFNAVINGHLEKAELYLAALKSAHEVRNTGNIVEGDVGNLMSGEAEPFKGKRTVENTLETFNLMLIELDLAANISSLTENVHPDAKIRTAAELARQRVSEFITELSLDRDVYMAIKAVTVPKDDHETKRLREHTLRDYRRSGVDKDDKTRNAIKALREEIVAIGQEFDRHIREGQREVKVSEDKLEGLPVDYIAAHEPGEDGMVTITTAYPDYNPVMKYAKSPELRKELFLEFNNRAYPENKETLKRLIEKRTELAKKLGYKTWADYIAEDKMVASGKNIGEFIQKLDAATKARGEMDLQMLLAAKRKDHPDATAIEEWERHYYSNKVQQDQFAFDSQVLRAYYNYPAVKQGILDLTEQLFAVEILPAAEARVWHSSVEAYDMFEGDRYIGRFFLDMHPRDGKFSHAAQFTLRSGVKDRQVPVAALVCNFPEPDENGLALMEHDQVETFLHEFGHLVHTLFGGHTRWVDQSGIANEWDFAEAPSQMLEEWALDPATLHTFAKHYETGEPIPADLIDKLRASKEFGNGLYVRQQNFYTSVSYHCYNDDVATLDFDTLVPELQAKYSPYEYVPGSHMYASFGHLEGYSAMYYTYMWSLVIAKDMFSKFNKMNLLDPNVSIEYRKAILEPGGTRDAADLVAEFLGRPYGFESFEQWMTGSQAN